MASERIKIIPSSEWDALARQLGDSLRKKVWTVLDQDGVGSCFPAGTLIRMADGTEKPIEKVQVLDEVVTAEGRTGVVTQTMVRKATNGLVRLLINGHHHLQCTPEHPILTKRGYVPACELTRGDAVAFPQTQDLWRPCEGVEPVPFDGHVFNLEVEGDHSYVAEGIGVHNCAAEATTAAVMLARAVAGLEPVELNPWFIYHHTSGGRDAGSSIDDNLDFVRRYGIAPTSVWPRSRGWRAKPSDAAYEAAKKYKAIEFYDISNVNELVSALLTGFPVVFGASGHAILGIEHRGNYPLILNSWGRGWGDGGFGQWCSYRAIFWNYGAFALRVAS